MKEETKKKFRIRRNMGNRMIAGVCSGIAHKLDIDPIWVRLIVVLAGLYFFPWVFALYLLFALVIPKDDTEDNQVEAFKKLYRIKKGKQLGGVCTGLEKYFDIDVVFIRIIFILLTIAGGAGLLSYIILWAITPELVTPSTTTT